jgi:exodeoxyribonuclease VII large subunit
MLFLMGQIPLFQPPILSVSDLTRHVRFLLESDVALQDVWVTGELSNLSRPASGHVYFTLKDAGAALRCVIWRSEAQRLRIPLRDGLAVEAHGHVSVYEAGGQYQLYVDAVKPSGEGALYAEFLRLKALLEAEGLFDPERKRDLPPLPMKIGIVTSGTGAALRDMLDTLRRRLPLVKVILAPAPVQGEAAPPALVLALDALNRVARPDVILLARGGGSIEDLWAFNDERLVRAVVASRAPVICGVGHETDFTLCDFAADLRAPTPTAAAELATPLTAAELADEVQSFSERLRAALLSRLNERGQSLDRLDDRLRFYTPLRRVQGEAQRVDELAHRSSLALSHRLSISVAHVKGLQHRLAALSPLAVLSRGYAMVTRAADGAVVHSVSQVREREALNVRVTDGTIPVETVATPAETDTTA